MDYVFTEQFLEHLSYEDGLRFPREVKTVLRPGGIIRQATPSLRGLLAIYLDTNEEVSQSTAVERHVHHEAGFSNVVFREFGESDHAMLQNRERHADEPWMRSAFVLICEGQA